MDVTRRNFKTALDLLKIKLNSSVFYAIDLELTGLPEPKKNYFEVSQEKYKNYVNRLGEIKAIQVGVALFERCRDQNLYKSSTFTFHLGPQNIGSLDQKIEWQAGAIQFLIKHNVDLAKNFHDGIPYMNANEESIVVNELSRNSLYLDIDILEDFRNVCTSIEKFVESPIKSQLISIPFSTSLFYSVVSHLQTLYPNIKIQNNGFQEFILTKEDQEIPKVNFSNEVIEYCRGFSTVINILSESKKPLIVHNGLIDLLVMHNQFINPLPSSYEEFKSNIHKFFPKVFDTKIITNDLKFLVKREEFCQTSLKELYEFFVDVKSKSICLHAPLVKTDGDIPVQFHEAGWDSYCTGFLFIKLCHWAICNHKKIDKEYTFTEYMFVIDKYCNQINLTKSVTPFVCLDKEDPPKVTPNYIHVESKDSKIDIKKISELLSDFHMVNIKKHGDGCALVIISPNINQKSVMQKFEKVQELKVTPYSVLKHTHKRKLSIWGTLIISTGALITLTVMRLKY